MSDFGQRIKELRKKFDLTQQGLADEIGANNKQTISDVEKGKQKGLNDDQVRIILDKYGISKAWLILGEGEMFELAKTLESTTTAINHQMISAPIMSIKASAGSGREQHEIVTNGELLIDRMLFKVLPNLKNIQAIEVEGDSMYPTLKDGDYVVIEKNSNFSGDGIYVLQYDGVLLVKRLQADIDGIEILSDNQSYGKRKYDPNDDQRLFHIAGKVILRMQR